MRVWTGTALRYRSLEPEDAGAVWRACAARDPRPGVAACRAIVDAQVDADQAIADQLALDGTASTRRLLALADGEPVGLVTIEVPADASGDAAVQVDPIVSAWAGAMEADARAWVERLGVAGWTVNVYAPAVLPEGDRALVWSQ